MKPVKNPLYVPPGNPEECGDYALDIYAGCPHNCPYCYAPDVLRISREKFRVCVKPRAGIVEGLEKQLREMREEGVVGKMAYLCPSCDPYPQGCDTSVTREVIQCLKRYGCHVRILTKGDGVRDADLLDMDDWYGVTLDGNREQWDRETMTYGGLSGEELFESLKLVHKRANTWVSFEPVLDAQMALRTLRACVQPSPLGGRHSRVADKVRIGKLDFRRSDIDWAKFGGAAALVCDSIGLDFHVTDSLRAQMRDSMSRTEFTEFIHDKWNVGDNCTLGPQLLDGAVAYAGGLKPEDRLAFFKEMLPSVPEIFFECIRY